MKARYISIMAVLILALGCAKSVNNNPAAKQKEMCPIHNIPLLTGHGNLPDGMTVSWNQNMDDALQNFPYVRRYKPETITVKYCTMCEAEVDKIK